MAQVVATIANGGTRYRPHYVKRVVAPDGTLRQEIEPEVIGDAPIIKDSTVKKLHAAMRDVVMTPGGTGHAGAHPRRRGRGQDGHGADRRAEAGRTGARAEAATTPGSSRSRPWRRPTIALAVLVEHAGGGGGKFAAPIAKQILEHYFTRDAGPQPHDTGDDGDEPRTRRRRPHAPGHRRGGVQEAHATRD